ncbi:MAG: hypothetical protein H6617_09370 [Bdellovibrionaceae bacterium]|nr:hypothetical protein [Pseudobdellovibrionaceae bacterium]
MTRALFILMCFVAMPTLGTDSAAPASQPPTKVEAAKGSSPLPTPKRLISENRAGIRNLRETLKPVPTGDAWLDGILSEWSGFAFDMADDVLRQFGLRQQKPAEPTTEDSK